MEITVTRNFFSIDVVPKERSNCTGVYFAKLFVTKMNLQLREGEEHPALMAPRDHISRKKIIDLFNITEKNIFDCNDTERGRYR